MNLLVLFLLAQTIPVNRSYTIVLGKRGSPWVEQCYIGPAVNPEPLKQCTHEQARANLCRVPVSARAAGTSNQVGAFFWYPRDSYYRILRYAVDKRLPPSDILLIARACEER